MQYTHILSYYKNKTTHENITFLKKKCQTTLPQKM